MDSVYIRERKALFTYFCFVR